MNDSGRGLPEGSHLIQAAEATRGVPHARLLCSGNVPPN